MIFLFLRHKKRGKAKLVRMYFFTVWTSPINCRYGNFKWLKHLLFHFSVRVVARITVPGKFAGKSGACSKCGEKVIAPKTQPSGHDSTPGSAIVDEVSGLHGSSADLLGSPVEEHSNNHLSPAESIESPTARLVARLWQELQHGGWLVASREVQDQFYHNSLSVSGLRGPTHCCASRARPIHYARSSCVGVHSASSYS